MTKANWAKMVKAGIAGSNASNCFVAALDCLLADKDIPASIYDLYEQTFEEQRKKGPSQDRQDKIYKIVLQSVYQTSDLKKIIFLRALNSKDFCWNIEEARRFNMPVILRVEKGHEVGLKSLSSGLWEMVGNDVPTKRHLRSKEVFAYLYIPLKTDTDPSNITIIG